MKQAMHQKRLLYLRLLCLLSLLSASYVYTSYARVWPRQSCYQGSPSIMRKAGTFCGNLVVDALRINWNLFTVTTAHIMTAFTPLYIASRAIDEDVQSRFYDGTCHKNVNQFSKVSHQVARFGVGLPMAGLSALMFFAPDKDMRLTARLFAIGWPLVHFTKDLIKKIDSKACLRPWNEQFSCHKRSPGGFPSGHMANITYTATLWWLRYGPKFGVPLSLGAAFVFANFVNCNRHYMSQLLAGAGFGMIYAFAVNRLIEQRISERISVCATMKMTSAMPSIGLSYVF